MESDASKVGQLSKSRILVVGDVMLDRYWFGKVDRISPEAPVPVVAVDETFETLGGAGNVARNVCALGGSCTLLSLVGQDENGHKVRSMAEADGIDVRLVEDPLLETTVKLRVVARNQQLMRADFESFPSSEALQKLQGSLESLVEDYNVVVFSDYGKGSLEAISDLIKTVRNRGKAALVDPKSRDFNRYRGATMITPNRQEFELAVGEDLELEEIGTRASAFLDSYALDALLITLGERGMELVASDGKSFRIGSRAREVFDVICVVAHVVGGRATFLGPAGIHRDAGFVRDVTVCRDPRFQIIGCHLGVSILCRTSGDVDLAQRDYQIADRYLVNTQAIS